MNVTSRARLSSAEPSANWPPLPRTAPEATTNSNTPIETPLGGKLLTVHEVAAYLDISVNTLRKWRAKNYGPVGRPMGKHIRYLPEDVEAWVKAQGEA